jgi:hypothetical protein
MDAVIRSWAEIKARSEFLENLEQDIAGLPESEHTPMQTRLALAFELTGPNDPMPHFQAWEAPAERYTPKCFEEEEQRPRIATASGSSRGVFATAPMAKPTKLQSDRLSTVPTWPVARQTCNSADL